MEPILQFLEHYWGYTLFGSVTVGAMVTFIVVQVKAITAGRLTNTKLGEAVARIDEMKAEYDRMQTDLTYKYQQSEDEKTELAVQNAFLQEVIATTFKSISYIALASKLPPDDKIALQADFTKLLESAKTGGFTVVKTAGTRIVETAKQVFEEEKGTVANIVVDAVVEAKTILDKYMNKNEV